MANNIHISYDLYAPGQNYERIIAKIKTLGSWARIQKSFWYLHTNLSVIQVRDAVWSAMDSNDSLYVVDATTGIATWENIPDDVATFIMGNWQNKAA